MHGAGSGSHAGSPRYLSASISDQIDTSFEMVPQPRRPRRHTRRPGRDPLDDDRVDSTTDLAHSAMESDSRLHDGPRAGTDGTPGSCLGFRTRHSPLIYLLCTLVI